MGDDNVSLDAHGMHPADGWDTVVVKVGIETREPDGHRLRNQDVQETAPSGATFELVLVAHGR